MHSFSEWLKRKRKALGALAAVLVVAGTAWLYAGAAGSGDGGGRLAERQQAEPDGGVAAERQPPDAGAGGEAGTAASPETLPRCPQALAARLRRCRLPPASRTAAPCPCRRPSAAPPLRRTAAASPAAKPSRADTVSLSVTGPAETGAILSKQAIAVEKGDTVLDVLKRATRAAKVQMEYSGEGAGAYVSGIGNVYQFDEGPGSGWLYSVGGEFPSKSAGAVKVEPGDVIEWRYTLDYGDDLGAPSAQQGGG